MYSGTIELELKVNSIVRSYINLKKENAMSRKNLMKSYCDCDICTGKKSIFKVESEIEIKKASQELKDFELKKLTANFSWVQLGKLQSNCRDQILIHIPRAPYFALKKDLYRVQTSALCSMTLSGLEFSTWLEKNKSVLAEEIEKSLEDRILQRGDILKKECLSLKNCFDEMLYPKAFLKIGIKSSIDSSDICLKE